MEKIKPPKKIMIYLVGRNKVFYKYVFCVYANVNAMNDLPRR